MPKIWGHKVGILTLEWTKTFQSAILCPFTSTPWNPPFGHFSTLAGPNHISTASNLFHDELLALYISFETSHRNVKRKHPEMKFAQQGRRAGVGIASDKKKIIIW